MLKASNFTGPGMWVYGHQVILLQFPCWKEQAGEYGWLPPRVVFPSECWGTFLGCSESPATAQAMKKDTPGPVLHCGLWGSFSPSVFPRCFLYHPGSITSYFSISRRWWGGQRKRAVCSLCSPGWSAVATETRAPPLPASRVHHHNLAMLEFFILNIRRKAGAAACIVWVRPWA